MSSTLQSSQKQQMAAHVTACKDMQGEVPSKNALLLRLEMVDDLYTSFRTNQENLEEKCNDKQLEVQFAFRASFTDQFFYCKVRLQDMLKAINEAETLAREARAPRNEQRQPRQQEVKLPKIELVPFSGTYEEWPTFHDLFADLIHNNANITNVQKLHYLKSQVTGDADGLLKSIPVTDANYAVAWEKLKGRFNHKRFIVNGLLTKFFGLPKVSSENHSQIKNLIDKSSEIIQALQLQGVQVGTWDSIIIHVIVSKLDTESHKQWELKLKKDVLPTFAELQTFLESRWQSLEMIAGNASNVLSQSKTPLNYSKQNNFKSQSRDGHQQQSKFESQCSSCNESNHRLHACPKYNNLSVTEKREHIKSKRLCFNCISSGHSSNDCQSAARCKRCNGKHHTSIHVESPDSNGLNKSKFERKTTATSSAIGSDKKVLLSTAVIYVHSSNEKKYIVKALVDPGSQNTIISTKLAKQLRLQQRKNDTVIVGIGDIEVPSTDTSVQLQFSSLVDQKFVSTISSSIMDKISGDTPLIPIHREEWPHLNGIKLADPHFDHPSSIDVLLGMEAYEQILLDGIIPKKNYSPTAQNSRLGWLLFGVVKISDVYNNIRKSSCLMSSVASNIELNKSLKAFWELEEIPELRKHTIKEQQAEEDFLRNVHQSQDGRYVVALPFDPELESTVIGESRRAALRGLFSMEARFKNNSQLKERYTKYIQTLIDSDHIELVPAERLSIPNEKKFYLPHHAVLKEESCTTKLRVVFDASRKSSTSVSLNDKLLVGPKTQEDLFNILIRWRKHFITLMADIEKMYRQVKIVQQHRDFQRLLWRFNEYDPIMEYRITTVIDGTASASFLATRALNKLAEDQSKNYPEASRIILEDFYVDNLASGCNTVEKAKSIQKDLVKVMDSGKMHLRQWYSNNESVLEEIPEQDQHDSVTLVELVKKSIKTLGIYWNQVEDTFQFRVTPMSGKNQLTKRELLSDISKLFDPIGWLSPSTLKAKIFMQSLWELKKLSWDDNVPEAKMEEWRKYRKQLHLLEGIKIPRWIGSNDVVKFQVHSFGDASVSAYAAVSFSRIVQSDGLIIVRNLSSKTKVAPIKTITIPKLELCGSLLVARLSHKVEQSLKVERVEKFYYSDNQTVLAWIKAHPNHYNTFVANRITEIQMLSDVHSWFFVSTDDNPADCASRGIFPNELEHHKLWWHGPSWLSQPEEKWPKYEIDYETQLEKRKLVNVTNLTIQLAEDEYLIKVLKKHSTMSKLLYNTAVFTAFTKSNKPKARKEIEHPNAQQLRQALVKWTILIQGLSFREEIERLKIGDELLVRSKLRKLRPFIDDVGLLRVGGRIRKSKLAFGAKHPIILPKRNHFTELLIKQAHVYTLHGGPTLMSTFLSNYWIFGRTEEVKRTIERCIACFPHRSKPTVQIMADLPINRVSQHRTFLHSGVDFAGPIITKSFTGRTRGKYANPTMKSYIAIFVCLSTKALHVDLVSDLTGEAFIACFKRFVAKRGKVSDLYSDNGKNFVSAGRQLRQAYMKLMKDAELQSYLAHDGTVHHFNPPLSPSFGGLWEAGVKSIKYHLKRLVGRNVFTYEEMTTLLYQIEACLNSRPLCPVSEDLNDMSYLTPGHFLIGEAPITVPEHSLLEENVNRLSRWQLIQRVYQEFWKVWYSEYLSKLQQRPKWMKAQENVKVGQLVLLRDEKTIPAKWPVARIIEICPGDDLNVRVVRLEKHSVSIKPPIPRDHLEYLNKLKTHKSVLKRNLSQISVLPIEDNLF